MSTTAKWVLSIAITLFWVVVIRTVMVGAPDRSMGLLDLIPVGWVGWIWTRKSDQNRDGIRALFGDESGSHDPSGLNSTDQDGRNSVQREKAICMVSLSCWIGVIVCGRLITVFRTPYYWGFWC